MSRQNDGQNSDKTGLKTGVGCGLALAFGLAYAHQVNTAERKGYIEGKRALFVVAGVGVTLGIRYVTMPVGRNWLEGLLYTALAFVFSGVPMTVNELDGHWRRLAGYRQRRSEWTRKDYPLGSYHPTATSANGVLS